MSKDNVVPFKRPERGPDADGTWQGEPHPPPAEELTLPDGTVVPAEDVEYHSILKVWRAMLDPEHQNRHLPPSADWCAIIIARWTFLSFADCGIVQEEYFRIFDNVHGIVEQVYEDNPEAFEVDNRDDDVEQNKDLYVFLLKEFQRALFVAQSEWSYDDPRAGAKMAALGEAQQQILGKEGLVAYLRHIGLPISEEENKAMNEELNEFRASLEG